MHGHGSLHPRKPPSATVIHNQQEEFPIILHRYIHLRIESNRCTTSRACDNLDQPHINAVAVKEVATTGKLPAPLAVTKAIEVYNATGFRCEFGSPEEAEVRKVVEVVVGTEAEAVKGAAEEEEDGVGRKKEQEIGIFLT
ncbi:unnamed protein product [Lupinus luteus]|uniref:Uncharacterized protein n=1 Tax=Lupinus luteus TaxID=3873 RepID=A0AAV1WX62_LUPLU